MPYVIAAIIIAVAAGAFFLFRSPVAEAPATEQVSEVTTPTTNEELEVMTDEEEEDTEPTTSEQETDDPNLEVETEAAVSIETPAVSAVEPVVPQVVAADYTGSASYSTGRAVHELDVTMTIDGSTITDVDIVYDGSTQPPTPTIRSFDEAYESEVIGQDINTINLSRVGGASWTSDAFNEAVVEIRAQL